MNSNPLTSMIVGIITLAASWLMASFAIDAGFLNSVIQIVHSLMVDLARQSGDLQAIIILAGRDGQDIAKTITLGSTFFIVWSILGNIIDGAGK